MINVGLLPITSDWKSLEKQSASSFVKGATEDQTADLCEVRRLAMKLPTLSKEMLEEQRAAFQGSGTASNVTEENAVETHCVDTGQSDPQALWVNLEKPSHRLVWHGLAAQPMEISLPLFKGRPKVGPKAPANHSGPGFALALFKALPRGA